MTRMKYLKGGQGIMASVCKKALKNTKSLKKEKF